MKKNKTIILSLILIMGVAFTACSRGVRGERTNLIRDGKTITVIEDSKDEQRKDELSLIGIEKHEDIRFMDWLDGDTILVTKDNTELGKIPVEDSKAYPKTFIIIVWIARRYAKLPQNHISMVLHPFHRIKNTYFSKSIWRRRQRDISLMPMVRMK